MAKRTIINPGAYSIFIRQMVRDDGLSIAEINRGIGWNDYYANTLLKDNKMPTFNNCLMAEAYFKEYFMRSNKFKRHLRKTIQVYPIVIENEGIDFKNQECMICLSNTESNSVLLPCGHCYHYDFIFKWF